MGRGRLLGRVLVGIAVVALVVLGVGAAIEGTLVYARTPGDVRYANSGDNLRVTGVVVPGSLRVSTNASTSFDLEGDGGVLPVRVQQALPNTFREGQRAVVEGRLGDDGEFIADQVIAQHGNTYRAPATNSGRF